MDQETIRNEILKTAHARLERYEALVNLADEQKTILLESKHTDLPGNLVKFDPLLLEIKQLDRREESLFGQYEEMAGMPFDDREYKSLASDIAGRAERLHNLAEVNRQLLDNAMEFVNFSINIVCKVAAELNPNLAAETNPALMLDLKV